MSAIAVGAAPPAAPSVAGAPSGVHVDRKEFSSDGIVAESSEIVATLLAWACNKVVPAALDDAASDTASTSASTSASSAAPGAAPVAPPPPIEVASDAAAADQPDDFDRLDVRLARLLHQQAIFENPPTANFKAPRKHQQILETASPDTLRSPKTVQNEIQIGT